jgi:hypothetical protein
VRKIIEKKRTKKTEGSERREREIIIEGGKREKTSWARPSGNFLACNLFDRD